MKATLRAVQRFFVPKRYECGKNKSAKSHHVKKHIAIMRDKYVLQMTREKEKITRRIVFMSESTLIKITVDTKICCRIPMMNRT